MAFGAPYVQLAMRQNASTGPTKCYMNSYIVIYIYSYIWDEHPKIPAVFGG